MCGDFVFGACAPKTVVLTETELDVASMEAAKGSDEEVVRGTRVQPKTPAEHTCAEY